MANYVATSRTNRIRVKDQDYLKEDLESFTSEVDVNECRAHPGYVVLTSSADCGQWPTWQDDDEMDTPIDWPEFFSRHLVEEEVAVVIEVGAEKMASLNGYAVAYSWEGKVESIDLCEIYHRAEEKFGVEVNPVEPE